MEQNVEKELARIANQIAKTQASIEGRVGEVYSYVSLAVYIWCIVYEVYAVYVRVPMNIRLLLIRAAGKNSAPDQRSGGPHLWRVQPQSGCREHPRVQRDEAATHQRGCREAVRFWLALILIRILIVLL